MTIKYKEPEKDGTIIIKEQIEVLALIHKSAS